MIKKEDISFIPVGKAKNLTNQVFGRWLVLGRAKADSRKAYWWCQCACGNIEKVRSDGLQKGSSTSCGCYKKEINIEQGKELAKKYSANIGIKNKIDLTGKKFNYLTVIEDTQKRIKTGNGTSVIWKCLCDCGKYCEVSAGHLKSNHTTSCGCRKMSLGEEKINNLLQNHNISFIREYIWKEKKYSTGGHPRMDFYVNKTYFIEYDGIQHFDCSSHGWNNQDNLANTITRDKEKNIFCHEENIPLIRIPYTHYNNIKLEDLLLETSNFIVKEEKNE